VRMLADGRVGLALSRLSGGTEAFPGGETVVPGLTVPNGTPVNVRVRTTGTAPTQVQAWAWTGATEPTAASITRSDATAAVQAAGAVGLTVHRPSGTTNATHVRFTSYRVTGVGGGGTPVNTPPTASFTATPSGLGVSVDGSASSDAGGSIASYAWNWGDSTAAGSGVTATHTYATAGTYTVTLTVTDDGGLTNSTTRSVTVTAAPPPAGGEFARDTFDRTAANGLGTADLGGAWTVGVGGTRQSVAPGAATMQLPTAGNNTGSYLGGVSQSSADVTTAFSLSSMPTGGGTYVYVTGRRVANQGEYRVRVRVAPNGQIFLALSRVTGTTEAFPGGELTVAGVTYTAGSTLNVRVQVSGTGTTQVTAKVWTGATEPAAPQMTRTDSTAALQAAGSVGLSVHRPGSSTAATAVRFTAFSARPVA
jgi:PKD repeat protein